MRLNQTMLSKRCPRHHSFLHPPKLTDRLKQSTSGTLSSDTITTSTSSGYSTGGSSVSTTVAPLSKKLSSNQHKLKSKGLHSFINKLKTLIISPKTKLINSTPSKDMSSTNMVLQYSTSYHLPPSTPSNNTISLPFTYYNNSAKPSECNQKQNNQSYVTATATNFEKISAWLDHTKIIDHDDSDLLFIDDVLQDSLPSSPIEIDREVNMKKTSPTNKTPKRSTSMVATMTRPVIEQKQYEKPVSPTFSFSSSILARGMAETMTPQTIYHQSRTNLSEEQTNILLLKSNRRRAIDFARRRTVGGPTEQMNNNKENVPTPHNHQIYRFSPTTSTNTATKKYYFHSNPPVKNEDILMNSYGLKILQQQQQQQQQSLSTTVKKSQITPTSTPRKSVYRRPSTHIPHQDYISDTLDDILCDREVESYFYPNRQQSHISLPQHIYINLGSSTNYYQPPPPPYIHSTLC